MSFTVIGYCFTVIFKQYGNLKSLMHIIITTQASKKKVCGRHCSFKQFRFYVFGCKNAMTA